MLFMRPSAKKYKSEWDDLEKLMVVVLLYHSKSLQLVDRLIDVQVPNMKSSAGAMLHGAHP